MKNVDALRGIIEGDKTYTRNRLKMFLLSYPERVEDLLEKLDNIRDDSSPCSTTWKSTTPEHCEAVNQMVITACRTKKVDCM